MSKLKQWKKRGHVALCATVILILSLSSAVAKTYNLAIGSAEMLKFDSGVSEVFIADPSIADVQLSNPNHAYIFGKAPGITKIFAVNDKGVEILSAEIVVSYNLGQLKEMIAPFDPHGLVELKSVPGAIILEGQVDSPKTSEDIRAIAEKFLNKTGDKASEANIINRLSVTAPVQVSLHVKVAEVDRTVLNQLAFDWQAVFPNVGTHFNFGVLTGRSPFTTPPVTLTTANVLQLTQPAQTTLAQNVSTLGANYTSKHVNLNAAIDLLAQDGLVTVLAEPHLMTVSGETASFLAGGEFPYPVPQQLGNITIDFKNYGVGLDFTPTVLNGNIISMRVRPEVSELDPTTGVTINGTIVPGILTRRAETTIQLASGQTFAIAGLLKNQITASISGLPGLSNLPVIGALFDSSSFQRQDSELVILVTPYLVFPASGTEMLLPTDGLNYATFVEQVCERRIVKQTTKKGESPAFGPGGVRLIGPAGFSIQ